MYHITTLSPFFDAAAGELDVVARGATHMQHRCVIADDLADQARDQFAPGAHQLELLGVFDQRHQPAAHGIACGVVAADDQKRDRADELAWLETARRFRMREHRDQVEGRRRIAPRIPQFTKIFAHFGEFGETLVL